MHEDAVNTPRDTPYRIKELLCRRTGRRLPPQEHARCPYCFGREDVTSGLHERFCDYEPERDPLHFGFPPDAKRDVAG